MLQGVYTYGCWRYANSHMCPHAGAKPIYMGQHCATLIARLRYAHPRGICCQHEVSCLMLYAAACCLVPHAVLPALCAGDDSCWVRGWGRPAAGGSAETGESAGFGEKPGFRRAPAYSVVSAAFASRYARIASAAIRSSSAFSAASAAATSAARNRSSSSTIAESQSAATFAAKYSSSSS